MATSPSCLLFLLVHCFLLVLLLGISGATTLVAARFKDGVVIGADSRTSQGTFVANRLTDKISSVYPGILLARSGSSAGERGSASFHLQTPSHVLVRLNCCRGWRSTDRILISMLLLNSDHDTGICGVLFARALRIFDELEVEFNLLLSWVRDSWDTLIDMHV